jgi:hypothetical protein
MLPCHKVAIDTQQYVYTHTSERGKTQHMSTLTLGLILEKYVFHYIQIYFLVFKKPFSHIPLVSVLLDLSENVP